MNELQRQLTILWRTHQEKHFVLIDRVKQAGLESSISERGGRTVGQQLAHVHNVRRMMLAAVRKDLCADLAELPRELGNDRATLRRAFEASGAAVEALIASTPDGKVKQFRGGLVCLVGYLVAHESHHRGGIVLTLKQAKQPLDKDSYWKLWGWSKGPSDAPTEPLERAPSTRKTPKKAPKKKRPGVKG